jgi:predicted nucleic acid-binding protein
VTLEDLTLVSSRIASTEVLRAITRRNLEWQGLAPLLRDISFRELTADIALLAGQLEPSALRTLDAIHLATALELRAELAGFLTYDARLAAAAREHGLRVEAPA